MCGRVCMETPGDKYYTENFWTIPDYNDCKGAPLLNEKIRDAIHKVMEKEEAGEHNITVDTFSHTLNTKRDNESMILTSEKQDKSDVLAENFKRVDI